MRLRLWMSAMALVLASGAAVAQTAVVAVMPNQVNWGPASGLPPDWQVAALMGDSSKTGPYVSRVKVAAQRYDPVPHAS
jgi:hypothetical protein